MSQNLLGNILPCQLNVYFVTWKCHKIINEAFVYVHIYNGKIYITQHVCCAIQCLFPKITHLQESHNCWLVLLRLSSKTQKKNVRGVRKIAIISIFDWDYYCKWKYHYQIKSSPFWNGSLYFNISSLLEKIWPSTSILEELRKLQLSLSQKRGEGVPTM